MDWYLVSKFLNLFSKPLYVKVISALGNNNGSRNLTLTQISEKVREQEKKVFNYCKRLLEEGFVECTNNALIEREKGYVRRQGIIPKFKLTVKGFAVNRIFHFIMNYEKQENLNLIEKQIQLGGEIKEFEEALIKILEKIKEINELDREIKT